MPAELHKAMSVTQKSITSQVFSRQIMYPVKPFEVDYTAQKASDHRYNLVKVLSGNKACMLIKASGSRQRRD